ALIAFFMYYFSYYFPKQNKGYRFPIELLSISTLAVMAVSLFTPYVLTEVVYDSGVQQNIYGFGYYVFSAYFFFCLLGGVYNLMSKGNDLDRVERIQMNLVLVGLITSGILAAVTNLILPKLLGNYTTGEFGPLAVSVFALLSTYAILKHHLFDIKVIAIEFLMSSIWIFSLFRFLASTTIKDRIMDGGFLVVVGVLGTVLIQTAMREINEGEKFEHLAKDLESANRRLEGLDSARREFLSFASHQLRTPMTVIKGYANLLTGSGNSVSKVKEIVTKISNSTDALDRLIVNFLDARAIEEGKMTYDFVPTDLVKIVFSVWKDLKPLADLKKLDFSFETSSPVVTINADELKLRQAVQNLVDNAIKYTSSGFVKVVIKTENGSVAVSVADSGRGFSQSVKESLFQQFVRDRTAALKTQGTGLGLYITKEIIKAHGGDISAESDGPDKGAKFVVKLSQIV
ncbi:MAG: hypothetical protein HYR95_02240, partial [Candidatus Colwellbacteria bacterium]|nr:hypothetical protein [Candidatus Colwellbacteria bacterium]